MSSNTDVRMTPRERLTRGLKYSAVGPVDVTRGAMGLGARSAKTSAGLLNRYRRDKLAERTQKKLAVVQEVVANLPQTLQDAREERRRRRPLVIISVGAVTLAGGAVAFSVARRSPRRERPAVSEARPPSVEVTPKA